MSGRSEKDDGMAIDPLESELEGSRLAVNAFLT